MMISYLGMIALFLTMRAFVYIISGRNFQKFPLCKIISHIWQKKSHIIIDRVKGFQFFRMLSVSTYYEKMQTTSLFWWDCGPNFRYTCNNLPLRQSQTCSSKSGLAIQSVYQVDQNKFSWINHFKFLTTFFRYISQTYKLIKNKLNNVKNRNLNNV